MSELLFLKKIQTAKFYILWMRRLWHPHRKTAYLLGTPTHKNIGDSAIVVSEIAFLKRCGFVNVVEITVGEYWSFHKCIIRLMPKKANIFLPGGGNMGSLWPIEENWRSQIIEDFSRHHIVVFPQTIYYTEDAEAIALKEKSISVYNTKPNLAIVAREQKSFCLMKQLYPNLNVLLAPDIVLSMGQQVYDVPRDGILICFRRDKEQRLLESDEEKLVYGLREKGYQVELSDTMSETQITVENRADIVSKKLQQFAKARLIITDRLHGMVFAAITGTPCLVLGNNHHKVEGTYKWLKDLDYVEFVADMKEAEERVDAFYKKENCVFYIDTELFSKLADFIKAMNN